MGDNYYTEVSDVLTDAFDVLLEQAREQNDSEAMDVITEMRAKTDQAFRANYKKAKESLQA